MKLVIWKKRDSSVYYKFVKGFYYNYVVGMKNQYGHEVLYVIPNIYYCSSHTSFKELFKRRLIRLIRKL